MSHLALRTGTTALLSLGALVAAAGPATAAPATTWTTVQHDVVFEERYDEDLCGRGSHVERFHDTVEIVHLTESTDGTFHFVDFETGTLTVDFDDPDVQDEVFRRTNTFTLDLVRGGVVTASETFRQFDRTATITYRFHLTEIDGVPTVEREVAQFEYTCP